MLNGLLIASFAKFNQNILLILSRFLYHKYTTTKTGLKSDFLAILERFFRQNSDFLQYLVMFSYLHDNIAITIDYFC